MPPANADDRPIYKRWWLWAGVGATLLVAWGLWLTHAELLVFDAE